VSISSIALKSAPPPQVEGARDIAPIAPVPASQEAQSAAPALNDASNRAGAVSKNPTYAQVSQAVKQVNDAFAMRGQNLYASIEKDKETGINIVKLLDKNTKEIVRQYPSKEIIAIAASIAQYQKSKGQLLDISA
jgi:flagellar protein FlaG